MDNWNKEDIRPLSGLGILKISLVSFCKFKCPKAAENLAVGISSFTPVNISVFGAEWSLRSESFQLFATVLLCKNFQ